MVSICKVEGDKNETCRTRMFVGFRNENFIFMWD